MNCMNYELIYWSGFWKPYQSCSHLKKLGLLYCGCTLQKECIVIMVQWQRHFLPVFRQIAHFATTSSPQGKGLTTLTARTILLPSISIRSPVYHSFQSQGISGSTCLLSKSSDLE
ncbi:hypothetical protein S83_038372 [Arachis hypogaea]